MSTTIQIPAETFPQRQYDGPIIFTYGGADPEDPGPAGRLMKAMIAQAMGDLEALKEVATAKTIEMASPRAPGQRIGVELGEARYEGDGRSLAVVAVKLSDDGQEQTMPFVMVLEEGQWKLDMDGTLNRWLAMSTQV